MVAAKILTVRDGNKIKLKGFEFVSSDNVTFTLLSLILQQNGTYLTDDGYIDLDTQEAVTATDGIEKFCYRLPNN